MFLIPQTSSGVTRPPHCVSHSAYGEGVFLILQTALIAALVLFFSGQKLLTLLFALVYPAALYYLVAGFAPMDVLWALQSANVPIIVAAKVSGGLGRLKGR